MVANLLRKLADLQLGAFLAQFDRVLHAVLSRSGFTFTHTQPAVSTHQLQLRLKSGVTRNCATSSQPFAQAFLQAFAHTSRKHAAVETAYLRATKDGWREPLSLLMLAHRAGSCRHLPVGADGKPHSDLVALKMMLRHQNVAPRED